MKNVTQFNLKDIVAAYGINYTLSSEERRMFKQSKYAGWKQGSGHKFWVLVQNDEGDGDDEFYISAFFVELNKDGDIVAEPSGQPDFEGTRAEMEAKFKSL